MGIIETFLRLAMVVFIAVVFAVLIGTAGIATIDLWKTMKKGGKKKD